MKKQEKYLSRRILACIIDYSLILIYTSVHFYLFGVLNEEGGYSLNGLPAFSVFIFWFMMTIGMEQFLGATIGNLINKIKPSSITSDGYYKISFIQSVKRRLLDPIDMAFFGIVALISINTTEKGQRLGDLWAKTKVIKI